MIKIRLKLASLIPVFILLASCADSYKSAESVAEDPSTLDERVIYGVDDRKNVYEETSPSVRKVASSTVALIRSSSLQPKDGMSFALPSGSYGASQALCSGENFYAEPAAAFCSGSLVGPNLILTAGHCVTSTSDCTSVRFVFGYALARSNIFPLATLASEVYACKRIVFRKQERAGADFALIELDRKVSGHAPLKLQRSSTVKVGDALTVIGHPSGLPTKIASGGVVRAVLPTHFVTNLDTYGGNSGSAVFNSKTNEVVGILVRGDTDFVAQGGCAVSNRCSASGCRGEDVTRIEQVLSMVR